MNAQDIGDQFPPLPAGLSTQADAAIAGIARDLPSDSLVRTLRAPEQYPVDALGPVLGPAAMAIADKTQCALATSGDTVLAAAALGAQMHRDVRMPHGETAPLSIYMVTVCESGERKSAADRLALAPVREVEGRMREAYEKAWPKYANHRDAYAAERGRIINKSKLDLDARRKALEALGEEPKPPLAPIYLLPELTMEGMVTQWPDAHGGLGVFMDEGGQFLGGYSMSKDHWLKTSTAFSRLWDGSGCGRLRAGGSALNLMGRRLSLHLMIQPGVARVLFGDEGLWDQGFGSRFLVAAPPNLAGKRPFRYPKEEADAALARYGEALQRLLEKPPATKDGRNELAPSVLDMQEEAEGLWIRFHDEIDRACAPNGRLVDIRGLAMKAPNHAARIAGVLTMIESEDARWVNAKTMANAIELCRYHIGETLRLRQASLIDVRMAQAETLRQWLQEWPEPYISASDIAHSGPNALRDVETVRDLMSVLETYGVVKPSGPRMVRHRHRRQTWHILSKTPGH